MEVNIATCPSPYWQQDKATLYHGNACDALLYVHGVDGVISDPPWHLRDHPRAVRETGNAVHHAEVEWLSALWIHYASWMALVQQTGAQWGWYFIGFDHAPMFLRIARVIGWPIQHAWPCGDIEWLFYTAPQPLGATHVQEVAQFTQGYGVLHEKHYLQLIHLLANTQGPHGCVLDPFCGSGSSLVAAQLLGATVVGIDAKLERCEQTKSALMSVMERGTVSGVPAPAVWHKRQKGTL